MLQEDFEKFNRRLAHGCVELCKKPAEAGDQETLQCASASRVTCTGNRFGLAQSRTHPALGGKRLLRKGVPKDSILAINAVAYLHR